jgi:hypothetical protein
MKRKWIDEQLDRYRMLRRLQLATLIGGVFIFVYSCRFWRSGAFASIFAVGMLSAGAFLLVGFLLGFVFGIPRTPKDSAALPSSGGQPQGGGAPQGSFLKNSGKSGYGAVEPNSNLVEISDWLTKIIVGVGLIQLNKIPAKVQDLTAYIGNGLRDCDSQVCKQGSESLALGIVIFFFCAGFLIGYLWARLYLQRAFTDLSLANQVDSAWTYADAADQAFDEGNFDKANELIDLAISNDPSNAKAHALKGRILKRLAQESGKPGDKALLQRALDQATQAASFNPNIGGFWYNMACYRSLLAQDRTQILKELGRAFEIDPKLKKSALADEDLSSLWEDADFKRLTS